MRSMLAALTAGFLSLFGVHQTYHAFVVHRSLPAAAGVAVATNQSDVSAPASTPLPSTLGTQTTSVSNAPTEQRTIVANSSGGDSPNVQVSALFNQVNALVGIVRGITSLLPALATSSTRTIVVQQPVQTTQTSSVNQAIAAGGNPAMPFAASNAINNLSGVTISNPTITGQSSAWNGSVIGIGYGGTGIPTSPTYGQLLLGQSNGSYVLTSTSSLGIIGSGTSTSSPLVAPYFTATATTSTSTFAGSVVGSWTMVDYDPFVQHAAGSFNGTQTPSGSTWTVTGLNAANFQITGGAAALTMPSGTQVAGENAYMYLTQATRPTRVGGRIKFYTSTTLATVAWNGQTVVGGGISLTNIIHVNAYANGTYEVSYYVPGASHVQVNCASSKEAHDTSSPLTLGQEYSFYASIYGDHLHVDLPQGGTADCYDPHFSQAIPSGSAGSVYWQLMDTSANAGTVASWDYIETDGGSPSASYPFFSASGGFQGPVGNITPSAVFATGLTIGAGTTTNGQLLVNSTNAYNPQAGIVVKNSAIAPQISLVATGSAVSTGIMGITFDQQTPGQSPSSIGVDGSAQNLKFTVGGEDRIVMQYYNVGVGIGTSTPWARLSVKERTGYDGNPLFVASDSNDINKFLITGSGLVGINNTNPLYTLDVKGLINTSGVVGGYAIDGNLILQASSTLSSTAVGYQALSSLIAGGTNNTALGYQALKNNTTGTGNVGLGVTALFNVTTGTNNLGIGSFSLGTATSSTDNVAVGVSALNALSAASGPTFGNIGIGSNAGRYGNNGSQNVYVGYQAGQGTAGYNSANNTIIGGSAGSSISNNSNNNAFLGTSAGSGGSGAYTSTWNTFIGSFAGFNATANNYANTCVGFQACYGLTSGTSNIILGAYVDAPNATGAGQLNIGNVLYGSVYNGLSQSSSPFAAGKIGVGTSTPSSRLTVWGPDSGATTSAFQVVNNASTTVFAVYDNGNSTYSGSIFQSSDQRLKTNVQSLDASSSLALINQLNPVTYNWIDPNKGIGHQYGFIAQQVFPIFPDLIATTSGTTLTPDGTLTLNYVGLISPIVKAVQALSVQFTSIGNSIAGYAHTFSTEILNAATGHFSNQLCVGATCVTPEQFAAMVAVYQKSSATSTSNAATSTMSNTGATTTSANMPPTIQINGNNPAILQIGATYNDLGATITGPQADLNLGIRTFLNGNSTSNLTIDTSKAATNTIEYVVTDQNGLASTSTRTVIIKPALITPPVTTVSTTAATSSSR